MYIVLVKQCTLCFISVLQPSLLFYLLTSRRHIQSWPTVKKTGFSCEVIFLAALRAAMWFLSRAQRGGAARSAAAPSTERSEGARRGPPTTTYDNLQKFENNELTASDRRILIATWYCKAYKRALEGIAKRRYFEHAGALLTADNEKGGASAVN